MSTPTTVMGEVRPESDCPQDASLVRLVYRRSFALPVAEIWHALTDPRRLPQWYGTFTGDPATGRVRLTMTDEDDSATVDVRIRRCTPPTGFSSVVVPPTARHARRRVLTRTDPHRSLLRTLSAGGSPVRSAASSTPLPDATELHR